MRTLVAALMIAALALPAAAEAAGRKHRGAAQTTERKPKVDEKAYGAALSTLPDKKYDPWQGVR
jgi:hypothetical protein